VAANHPQAFDKLGRGAALEASDRRNTQAPKVPKVQFSFKVVPGAPGLVSMLVIEA